MFVCCEEYRVEIKEQYGTVSVWIVVYGTGFTFNVDLEWTKSLEIVVRSCAVPFTAEVLYTVCSVAREGLSLV